jgi:N-acetylmuramoyl-L-alanine amidase
MPLPTTDKGALVFVMMGEARGQGGLAMRCVGHTVLNRVARHGWQGKTILEVCFKPEQYSCTMPSDPNYDYLVNNIATDPVYNDACDIADGLIAGTLADITNGAVSYYSPSIPVPSWAIGHVPCYELPEFIFFNDIA